eukprot:1661105-Pyramimonas_sp.AAC.1
MALLLYPRATVVYYFCYYTTLLQHCYYYNRAAVLEAATACSAMRRQGTVPVLDRSSVGVPLLLLPYCSTTATVLYHKYYSVTTAALRYSIVTAVLRYYGSGVFLLQDCSALAAGNRRVLIMLYCSTGSTVPLQQLEPTPRQYSTLPTALPLTRRLQLQDYNRAATSSIHYYYWFSTVSGY